NRKQRRSVREGCGQQSWRFSSEYGDLVDLKFKSPICDRRTAGKSFHNFSRNSSFRSAEGALLARRLNEPFVLMACAARRNAPHAANARPEPTEMRRTPRSPS